MVVRQSQHPASAIGGRPGIRTAGPRSFPFKPAPPPPPSRNPHFLFGDCSGVGQTSGPPVHGAPSPAKTNRGVRGLVLGCRPHSSPDGQVCQKCFDLRLTPRQLLVALQVVEFNGAVVPFRIAPFCVNRIVMQPHPMAHLVQQPSGCLGCRSRLTVHGRSPQVRPSPPRTRPNLNENSTENPANIIMSGQHGLRINGWTARATMRPLIILAACAGLLMGGAGCKPRSTASSAIPLTIQSVRQMSPTNATHISCEERGGEIFVSVTDRFGDAHIHKLTYEGISRQQALEVLKQKQTELEAQQ